MPPRKRRHEPLTTENQAIPLTTGIGSLLDQDLERQNEQLQLEEAVDRASMLTDDEIARSDQAWRGIFEKLGIAAEVDVLVSVENDRAERVRKAIEDLHQHNNPDS